MSFLAERRHKHRHPELHNIMRNSVRSVAAGLKPGLKNTALHSNPLKDIPPTPPRRQDNSQAKREREIERKKEIPGIAQKWRATFITIPVAACPQNPAKNRGFLISEYTN